MTTVSKITVPPPPDLPLTLTPRPSHCRLASHTEDLCGEEETCVDTLGPALRGGVETALGRPPVCS